MSKPLGSVATISHAIVNTDWTFTRLSMLILFVFITYPAAYIFYNIFLHPLRSYPGPRLYAASIIPISYARLRGRALPTVQTAHKKYGPVVRLAPNEISYIDIEAWKDIYGHRKPGQPVWRKDPKQAGPEEAGTPGIFRSEGQGHVLLKRTFNHAFSDKALRDQQDLIRGHALALVSALRDQEDGQKISSRHGFDLVKMYNFVAFDLLSDLTFGEPLGLLKNGEYTPWVHALIGHVRSISIMHAIARWPLLAKGMKLMLPASVKQMRQDHFNFCVESVEKRIARKDARPDFWSLVVEAGTHRDISKGQLYATMSDFMFAGTETTATILSGMTWYLCRNPEKLELLVKEIRQFENFEDLDLKGMQALPYLNACLDEAFRLYPPVPVGNMRLAPAGASTVCGRYVPAGTTVEYAQYVAYRSSHNYTDPESFVPERFLANPPKRYLNDVKGVLNPFGVGPRTCIGKNLALHQTRMIFTAVLWHFDVTLVEPDFNWFDQEVHELWLKHPLLVKVKAVRR